MNENKNNPGETDAELVLRLEVEEKLTKELTSALQTAVGGVIETIAQDPEFQDMSEKSLIRILKKGNQGVTQHSFLNSFKERNGS